MMETKVGASEWNHVHRMDQFLLGVLGSVPKFLISIDSFLFCREYYVEYF